MKLKRVAPGWLARSIADARAWAAIPENRRWIDQVRANWKDQPQ